METKPHKHLLNILKETKNHHPNFTLLLGAGASKTSGVKLASEMILDWRKKFADVYPRIQIETLHWHKTDEEYSILFEKLFDEPSQRREYIENCILDSRPSWGYVYLVNLLQKNVFNTVFTTNFDDLLNEACYLFSRSLRPLVCAHDSSVNSVRITSKRPKIIKLHGDFLFDNIKNTIGELESLGTNIRDKFKQYATEFGLIVVGYSGSDRSVMDVLESLLKSESYFPHGIYWCIRDTNGLPERVKNLCRYKKFNLIKISNFDDLFADTQEELGFQLQEEMRDPFSSLKKNLDNLIGDLNVPEGIGMNKTIGKDIKQLADKIQERSSTNANEQDRIGDSERTPSDSHMPNDFLAEVRFREGNLTVAKHHVRQQLLNSATLSTYNVAVNILCQEWDDGFWTEVKGSIDNNCELFSANPMGSFDLSLKFIRARRFDQAEYMLSVGYSAWQRNKESEFNMEYYLINVCQIYRHKEVDIPEKYVKQMEQISQNSDDIFSRIGSSIVLGKEPEAIELLKQAIESGFYANDTLVSFLNWPIASLLSSDAAKEVKEMLE